MSAGVSPETTPDLDEILVCLRAVMTEERQAIVRLDLAALEGITARKLTLCDALAAVVAAPPPADPGRRARLAQTRFELAATQALAAAAAAAVAAALGIERDDRYDRSARSAERTRPLRTITL